MGVEVRNPATLDFLRYLKPVCWNTPVTSATYTAGRVYLQYIQIESPCKVHSVIFSNAATIAGNVTVGLYKEVTKDTPVGATLVCTSADTAHAGANAAQEIAFTADTQVGAGSYYLAIELSDATATILRSYTNNYFVATPHYYDRAGGYGALTDPVPAVTYYNTAQPGMVLKTTQ